jgi:tight adherence protein C
MPFILAFCSLILLVYIAIGLLQGGRAEDRLNTLSKAGSTSYPSQAMSRGSFFGGSVAGASVTSSLVAQRLRREERRNRLKERMVQAGLYSQKAARLLLALRIASLIVPILLGYAVAQLGWARPFTAISIGVLTGLAGVLAPSFWLDYLKVSRQNKIRRSLPDALDLISVCVEGGLSLPASIARVARELATAHPLLGLELAIVERQTQMGRSTGQAMKELATRFDLEELRSLAAVILHAERYGTSVTKALAVYAETLRTKRHQRAEEMAQKATIKMLFPTLFLIFPGIFVVVLGPAAIQIYEALIKVMARQGG